MNDLDVLLNDKPWGKSRRILAARWNALLGGEHFQVPQTREDIQALYFKVPSIQSNYVDFFFKESGLELRQEIIEETARMFDCRGLSRSFLAQTLHEHLSKSIARRAQSENDDPIPEFLRAVASELRQRSVTFRVEGIELSGFAAFERGSWRLHLFSDSDARECLDAEQGDPKWHAMLQEDINLHFAGKLCITLDVVGDREGAEREASRLCEGALSGLRYAVMIHADAGEWGRRFFIYQAGAPMPAAAARLNRPQAGKGASFGRTFEGERPYTLYERNLAHMESEWHLSRYWDILASEQPSDVERSVENAMRWLGDASLDHDLTSSFIKTWIALEALVTSSEEEKLSDRLSKFVPLLIWLSGVATPPDDASLLDPVRLGVKDLYERRCALVHGRDKSPVTWQEHRRVSRWAYRCIAGSLGLLAKGVQTRKAMGTELANRSRRLGWET